MSPAELGRLPSFLRHLSTLPAPDEVLRSLHDGPLETLGMRGGMMWRLGADGGLVGIGAHGHQNHEVARYATIPPQIDLPIVTAVRQGRFIALQQPDLPVLHLTQLDRNLWEDLGDRAGIVTVLNIPLMFADGPVGALGVATDRPWSDTPADFALVSAIGAALGLWLTHPRVALAALPTHQRSRSWSLAFTARQSEVLLLVDAGQSTAQIAEALHVSESTVKQDLQWAMSALRTNDRRRAARRARELHLV